MIRMEKQKRHRWRETRAQTMSGVALLPPYHDEEWTCEVNPSYRGQPPQPPPVMDDTPPPIPPRASSSSFTTEETVAQVHHVPSSAAAIGGGGEGEIPRVSSPRIKPLPTIHEETQLKEIAPVEQDAGAIPLETFRIIES